LRRVLGLYLSWPSPEDSCDSYHIYERFDGENFFAMVFFLHIVTYDWKAIVIDDGGTFELACLARFLIDGDERSPIHRILREGQFEQSYIDHRLIHISLRQAYLDAQQGQYLGFIEAQALRHSSQLLRFRGLTPPDAEAAIVA
jgi:hypothetical protein